MPKRNRLRLDWSLDTQEDRTDFAQEYLAEKMFQDAPPTSDELETISNYILWGKKADPEIDPDSLVIELERRNKTWEKNAPESLEALFESVGFNEASLQPLSSPRLKVGRKVFDREKALEDAPAHLQDELKSLFALIDKTDLQIELFELAHGRRHEIRKALLRSFTEAELDEARARVAHWNQFRYLKMRHFLVELRTQQYQLRDAWTQTIFRETPPEPANPFQNDISIDSITILPLGVPSESAAASLIFRPAEALIPQSFTESELKLISKFFWAKREAQKDTFIPLKFDFRDQNQVFSLFAAGLAQSNDPLDATDNPLLATLFYYIQFYEMDEIWRAIINHKMEHWTNPEIAAFINKKYGKSYSPNYISTIFRQRIIPAICAAAQLHFEQVARLAFPEEFKTCRCCGRTLLRTPDFFVRKGKSVDGLSAQCKQCDKKKRDSRKSSAAAKEEEIQT